MLHSRFKRVRPALALAVLICVSGCGDSEHTSAETSVAAGGGSGPPGPQLELRHVYMGVSCNGGNEIGCDAVSISASTPERADFLVASLADHQVRLDPVGRSGGFGLYQGEMRAHGLLHSGPLAVRPEADGRWYGEPRVAVPVTIGAVRGGWGLSEQRTLRDVTLHAGFG